MDEHGVVIASGEPSRLRQRHEGAILALKENRIVEIDSATANQLKGVRSGINLPISFMNSLSRRGRYYRRTEECPRVCRAG